MVRTRRMIQAAAGAAVVTAAAAALWPRPAATELGRVTRGTVGVVVEGPGRTRVLERYTVAAPVGGHLLRPALRAGDVVTAGQALAHIAPAAPSPFDTRTRAEVSARAAALRAAQRAAAAVLERARHAADQADRERERARSLVTAGALSARALEEAALAAEEGAHAVETAAWTVRQLGQEAAAAEALLRAGPAPAAPPVVVPAPASGTVLRVLQESEGPVAAGTPLLELGDPARTEARLELLTSDAVRVRPGAEAELFGWGGGALAGVVRRVEPSAFTKVSALGIEEQRVGVVIAPREGAAWSALGDGFAVDARITVVERPGVLKVPASALVRAGGGWAVFRVERGRVRLVPVRLGELATQTGEAEVQDGLTEGDLLVLDPGDAIADGVRVIDVRR